MNAQLLTVLPNAAPAKSGIGALQSKASDAKGAGVGASFADLLGQQTDSLDAELLEMMGSLGLDLDPQAQKELLAQLKEFGVDPDQLNKLLLQFKGSEDAKQLPAALLQSQANNAATSTAHSIKNTKESADFINSTLFIANESRALRSGQAALAGLHQDAALSARFTLDQDAVKKGSRFDLRFDLAQDGAATKKVTPSLNSFQPALHAVTDGAKAAPSASSTLLTELSGLSAQSHSTPSHSATGARFNPTYSAQITTPLNQTAQWSADFGRVMVQMSQQAGQNQQAGLQTAEIRLDPPELGPLRIMLSINEGVANAMIFAAHAQTRQAIELSLPQLQQQLAQSGLSLGEANVSDQNFFAQSEQQSEQSKEGSSEIFSLHGTDQGSEADALAAANTKQSTNPNAIIDTFA